MSLHVVLPDITREHWNVNIRKFVVKADHLEDLVRLGTLTRAAVRFLDASVVAGLNILVAGGTQSGKPTSVENALPGTCRVRRPLAFRPHSPDMSKALVLSNRLRGRCSWPSVQSRDHPVRQLVWSACRAHRGWLQRT